MNINGIHYRKQTVATETQNASHHAIMIQHSSVQGSGPVDAESANGTEWEEDVGLQLQFEYRSI